MYFVAHAKKLFTQMREPFRLTPAFSQLSIPLVSILSVALPKMFKEHGLKASLSAGVMVYELCAAV